MSNHPELVAWAIARDVEWPRRAAASVITAARRVPSWRRCLPSPRLDHADIAAVERVVLEERTAWSAPARPTACPRLGTCRCRRAASRSLADRRRPAQATAERSPSCRPFDQRLNHGGARHRATKHTHQAHRTYGWCVRSPKNNVGSPGLRTRKLGGWGDQRDRSQDCGTRRRSGARRASALVAVLAVPARSFDRADVFSSGPRCRSRPRPS